MVKKYIISSLLAFSFVAVGALYAQTITPTATTNSVADTCVTLSSAVGYGSSDSSAAGSVTLLQKALISSGYLQAQPNGSFGPATLRAVKAFQAANGITATGFAGALTKAKIRDVTCGIVSTNPLLPPIKTTNTGTITWSPVSSSSTTHTCQFAAVRCPNGKVMQMDMNTCALIPSSCDASTTTLTPLGTFTVTGMSTGTSPSGCATNQIRLCSDGTMMGRNPVTCQWIESTCRPVTGGLQLPQTSVTTGNAMCAEGSTKCGDVIITKLKVLASSTPIGCSTMDYKVCANGTPMPRDASCTWRPEQCSTTSVLNYISPINSTNSDVVKPPVVVTNPNVTTNKVPGVALPPAPKDSTTTPPVPVLTKPTGIMCTMEMRLCPNGERMYRDSSCGWHPEKCSPDTGTNGMQCTKDPVTGYVFCGAPGAAPSAY